MRAWGWGGSTREASGEKKQLKESDNLGFLRTRWQKIRLASELHSW